MAMWAGVQNVSRPIERCHEMSQMTPTFALVAAITAAATYHGTTAGRDVAGAGGVEPNGSFDVTCSSHLLPEAVFWASATPGSATEPVNEGKLYSLLPSTASRQ